MKKIFLIPLLLLTGCASKLERAKIVAYQNPKEFAEFCAVQFPIKETTVTNTVYIPADNKDFTAKIGTLKNSNDSLNNEIERLNELAKNDISGNCDQYKPLILSLNNKAKALTSELSALKKDYEKCKSDTLKIDTKATQESSAKLTDLRRLYDKQTKELTISETKRETSDKERKKLIFWVIVLGIALGGMTYLKFKPF